MTFSDLIFKLRCRKKNEESLIKKIYGETYVYILNRNVNAINSKYKVVSRNGKFLLIISVKKTPGPSSRHIDMQLNDPQSGKGRVSANSKWSECCSVTYFLSPLFLPLSWNTQIRVTIRIVIRGLDHLSLVVALNMYEVRIRNKWISVRVD